MEFNLNTQQLFKVDKDGIGILNGINLSKNNTERIFELRNEEG